MAKKYRARPEITLHDGSMGKARYRTDYWFDRRHSRPSPHARSGFPFTEDGSIEGAGRVIMKGHCAKIACFDRVKGRYKWTIIRGERIAGTNLYQPIVKVGEDG